MDVIATPTADGKTWNLADLLGRSMGSIAETRGKQFIIQPEGHALETMSGIEHGPHASLDDALSEIERHTRGVCRAIPFEDRG